jgi:hypothetical protein
VVVIGLIGVLANGFVRALRGRLLFWEGRRIGRQGRRAANMPEPIKLTLATLTTFGVLVGAWMTAIWWFQLPAYILPQPASSAERYGEDGLEGIFWEHALFTLRGAMSGFLLGGVAGLLMGISSRRSELRALCSIRGDRYPVDADRRPCTPHRRLPWGRPGIEGCNGSSALLLSCVRQHRSWIAGSDPRLLDLYRAASASS